MFRFGSVKDLNSQVQRDSATGQMLAWLSGE